MPETLDKLRPDRDLQCYFERPTAIAALSESSPTGFTVSGTWRQQFDWAVIEWNRDNVFEHPALRNLPDGNLSGLTLTYDEERTNCIPIDSNLFPTVDWPFLRIWVETPAGESFHRVRLKNYATAVAGSYVPATATFTLQGSATAGDYVGLAWADEQYNYQLNSGDTLDIAAQNLADAIHALSPTMDATASGASVMLTYKVAQQGANGNRLGAYGFVSGARTETWSPGWATFSGGTSPSKWRIQLDFSNLNDEFGVHVETQNVRKMRWTHAAELQSGAYTRSEFAARISQWTVTGTNRGYQVAGPGSRRLEDSSDQVSYSGSWGSASGNFSGGSIHHATTLGASVASSYQASAPHVLYLGTRRAANGGRVSVSVNGGTPQEFVLALAGEDVLVRIAIATLPAGSHTVAAAHSGADGTFFYFDFFEIAIPASELPEFPAQPKITLATDWDTDHSIALAPERSLWNMYHLGYQGRINHYVGALWFYELAPQGYLYASATVTFTGTPVFSELTRITITRGASTHIDHVNLIGETAADVAKAFELRINSGYTAIRATAAGNVLTVYSRSIGEDGNAIQISASPASGSFTATVSSSHLAGGFEGEWRTDLAASPRLNRAVRDWCRSFYAAAHSLNLDVVAAFSTELQHGDPSVAAGIAQRYPSGEPVLLNTPALQTNFSPTSLAYWREVYKDMAAEMVAAGCVPYLQFGEVQWWYFAYDPSGLPFHDAYTKETFLATYGFPIRAVADGYVNPALYPQEAEFLPTLIGSFTTQIMSYVRATYPGCRFEVLYPTDVNEGAFNRAINYPASWNQSTLDCLKTESFTYTFIRDLDKCLGSIQHSETRGFSRDKRSHLIGISDVISPWLKETRLALAENLESIVLFALDQYCLIGYPTPLPPSSHTGREQG